MAPKNAIVLAMFGTTEESALPGLLKVHECFRQAYPLTQVRLAFTSNIIRNVWRKRAHDTEYRLKNTFIPEEIFTVQGQLAAIANLQDQGYRSIVVQAIQMAPAEEFHDLASYVKSLAGIRTMKPRWQPFEKLVIGRPILGTYSPTHPYGNDILELAKALEEDVKQAAKHGAALVYMGHGNPFFPSGGLYLELESRMRTMYPQIPIHIGTVEGYPSLDEVLAGLATQGAQKVLLKPLLIVAGSHALKDMVSQQPASWQSRLATAGHQVIPMIKGLGEQTPVARLFVQHAAQAAENAGIELQ
ncbi:sirohydrochlorin cobaltochelatase [Desulfogranum marinum]|uniref:sirohydrochlorin cobaltochelatase n=1 Tax=Desulfogranum marinum TaxID=453220 RepID=UPI0019644C6D|nr:sirohydrochlorin cobaltochelatase [Desulfogranum marinum]MBM9513812.1 sirohydrochlorin cobaltochelatase [Desulfogranum marinum]